MAKAAVLAGRLIFAAVFIMAVSFKLMDINATAGYIASAGFPLSKLLAWLAALLELALVACFLTGVYFSEAALLAAPMCCSSVSRSTGLRIGQETRLSSGSSWTISHSLPAFSLRRRTDPGASWR